MPWLALLFWPLLLAPVARDVRPMLWATAVLYALHPMTWYYVNELRPYIALTAGSTLAGAGLFALAFPSSDPSSFRLGTNCLIVGCGLMAAMSPLGAIWATGFVTAAGWLAWRTGTLKSTLDRQNWRVLFICMALLLPIFYHYVTTLLAGVSATTLHAHRAANFVFGFYELAGLSGLGPGRDQLRVIGPNVLWNYSLQLAVACAILGTVGLFGLRALLRQRGADILIALTCVCLPLVALWILGSERSWRVVGRHMLPMLFVVNVVLAWGIVTLWRHRKAASKVIVAFGLLALASSAMSIRHGERHQREMYARAAAAAEAGMKVGGTVWWFADPLGIRYYAPSVRLQSSCASECPLGDGRRLVAWQNPATTDLEGCPRPSMAILSRRDTYDRAGAGIEHLSASGLRPVEHFERL